MELAFTWSIKFKLQFKFYLTPHSTHSTTLQKMYKALIVLALACVALASDSYVKAPAAKAPARGYAPARKGDGYGYNYAHAANKAREAKVRANLYFFYLKMDGTKLV